MGYLTAMTYWVIVAIWGIVLLYTMIYGKRNQKIVGSARILLIVIGIDALRGVFENVYFGFYFGSKYGLFPERVSELLGHPILLFMPKLVNVVAGLVVIFTLLLDWFPKATKERTSLDELASIDALTGLFNRRHFLSLATIEYDRAVRYARPLSLLMLDIDFFKKINDMYGHKAGDVVIAQVAKICETQCRDVDVPARFGGEEFVVLIPEAGSKEATLFAERLRQQVERMSIAFDERELKVTISIGVASITGKGGIDAMLVNADKALYTSKSRGRNVVSLFE